MSGLIGFFVVSHGPTAGTPVENPYRSCRRLTRVVGGTQVLFAIIAMHTIGDCNDAGAAIAARTRSNFWTFGDAVLASFQIFTGDVLPSPPIPQHRPDRDCAQAGSRLLLSCTPGEDWVPLMFQYMGEEACGWTVAPMFVAAVVIYRFVLLNPLHRCHHGLSSNKMALVTSDCGTTRSLRIKRP